MPGRAAARLAAYQDLIRSAYRRWTNAPDAKLPGRTLDLEIKTVRDVTGLCTVLCAYRWTTAANRAREGHVQWKNRRIMLALQRWAATGEIERRGTSSPDLLQCYHGTR
jgi:hypothetical protein